jgi:hypothetical protein
MARKKKSDCEGVERKLTSVFDFVLWQALADGDPAEHRVSDYEFTHNYDYIDGIIEDALDEVGVDVRKCIGVDVARDIMEAHWQTLQSRGRYEKLSKKVEPL